MPAPFAGVASIMVIEIVKIESDRFDEECNHCVIAELYDPRYSPAHECLTGLYSCYDGNEDSSQIHAMWIAKAGHLYVGVAVIAQSLLREKGHLLLHLFVNPIFRGKGLGGRLLDKALDSPFRFHGVYTEEAESLFSRVNVPDHYEGFASRHSRRLVAAS